MAKLYNSIELYSGTEPQVIEFPQKTAPGPFYAGDLVTSGTAGVLIASVAATYLGFARIDSDSDVTGKTIPVELINLNSVYSVRLCTTAVGDGCGPTGDTLIGDAVGIKQFTAGAHMFTDTLETDAYVVGMDPRDTVGTVAGRILIRFISTALAKQY